MQQEAGKAIRSGADVVVLSPTGTGKTLAFLLPLIARLDDSIDEIQALILVPTRELAQQIEQVARKMGSGFKVNAVYGGRTGSQDKIDLKHRPAILIGTPGRIADRFRRDPLDLSHLKTLVLDEYDKSLEIGFAKEMEAIVKRLSALRQRILTSATREQELPAFVGLREPIVVDYLRQRSAQLSVKILTSEHKDKLAALGQTLTHLGHQLGIIFCNYKDGLQRVSDFLSDSGLAHEIFHGDLEQADRVRALVKFRNGTSHLLLATDLAARGLDIPEIQFIIHYHLPPREKEFTHRNGRTARMHSDGVAYVLAWEQEELPDYLLELAPERLSIDELKSAGNSATSEVDWTTLHVSSGRRDKVSKGDIAGFFFKQGDLTQEQLGLIEVQQHCAYVAVDSRVVAQLVARTNDTKLKRAKVRVSVV